MFTYQAWVWGFELTMVMYSFHPNTIKAMKNNRKLISIFSYGQKELNSQNGAWDKISAERDPFILSGLMWSWIEQLKEPILTKDDVAVLASNRTESQETLKLLEKVGTIHVRHM